MLIIPGMLWKHGVMAIPGSRQERGLVCILQDEKLTNTSGLEVFLLIRLWACKLYLISFFLPPFPADMQSEGI